MSNRKKLLGGSTVLLFALSYGCAAPTGPGGATNVAGNLGPSAGAGLISNNAGGLISNNAGGLISNNAGGLISNNAGGLISNNAGGLISNNAGGLISNNAGGLTGVVNGPAAGLISNNAGGLISNNAGGLISNNAGGLISNNAGGLISNNAGGLISNNAGGYNILQAADAGATAPVAGARVAVFNERGEQVSYAWSTTNEQGEYSFKRLKPSGPMLFVKAVYQSEGRQVTLMSVAPAPREEGLKTVAVSPATSFVAKKINEMTRLRAVSVGSVKAESVTKMVEAIAPKMSERAIVAAVIFPADKVAETFDFMLGEGDAGKALSTSLGTVLASVGAPPALILQTPKAILPPPSAVAPSDVVAAPTAPSLPGATDPSGSTDSGALPGADEPAPVDSPETSTEETTVTATVGTLASGVTGAFAANGSKLVIAKSSNQGLASATVSSFDKASFSLSTDTSVKARAVTFGDDGKQYALVGSTIVGYTKAVSATELASGSDLAVKGSKAYVASETGNCVYEVDMETSAVTVLAGNPDAIGDRADGTGTAARFWGPQAITFAGNDLYVADTSNHIVRKVTTAGVVTTFAGSGALGNADGSATTARFQKPSDLAADSAGNLYVADRTNSLVRKIAPDGAVTTIAGTSSGNVDGVGLNAKLSYPTGIALGTIGGTQVLFVGQADGNIRVLSNW